MSARCARIERYRDIKGEYRWRLLAKNGRVVADSAEGYDSLGNLNKAIARFMMTAIAPRIVSAAGLQE
jgi:uncharacterized protein YegP (UPF0339 family)